MSAFSKTKKLSRSYLMLPSIEKNLDVWLLNEIFLHKYYKIMKTCNPDLTVDKCF